VTLLARSIHIVNRDPTVALYPHTLTRNTRRFLALCLSFLISFFISSTAHAAPPPPAIVQASSGGTYAYVNWSAVSGATSYTVKKEFGREPPISTTATDMAYFSVTLGGTYTFQVNACNSTGCSAFVNAAPVTITAGPPQMPNGVTATASGNTIAIGWTAVSGASSYTIQKTVNGTVSNISGVTGTAYTDANLAPATTYTYNVKACNAAGCSAISAGASATTAEPLPAAPASVSAMSLDGYAYISWTPVSGATSYRVLKVNGMTAPATTSATSYADTSVTVGNTYTYQVTACNSSGCSAGVNSNAVTIAPPAPQMPTGVMATASGGAIVVGWNAVSGATSYTIQKNAGGVISTITGVSGTSYSDRSISAGASYTYNVKACNSAGCSANSAGASATAPAAVPAAPTSVSAMSVSGYAYISWSAVSGATSYRVLKVNGMTAPATTSATSYADTSVTVGNTYTYQVTACNSSGCSAGVNSNAVTIAPPAPQMPTGVTATASGGAIVVGWSAVSGATSYTIQKNAGGVISTITGVSGTSYSDRSITAGMSYTYNVKACNSAGCSANSAGASATAPAAVPGAPVNVSAMSVNGYAYVSWSAASGATSYRVQRLNGMTAPATTSGTDYADTSVTVGNTYTYQVAACNSSGCSSGVNTNVVTITAPAPSAAPGGLALTPGQTTMAVRWNAVSGATYYSLQRTPTGAGFPVASITATSYGDSGLSPATTYGYSVRACNSAGCSSWSAQVSGTTSASTPPAQPASLIATQEAATVRLVWPASANATLYKLRRLNGPAVVALPDTAATSALDAGVAVDIDYIYQVQACNSGGCSAGWTASAVIRVPHIPAPPAPVSAVVRQNGIYVSWPNNDTATSFKLSRNGSQIASAATSPHADTGVVKGTSYVYGVSACNATGCSAVATSAAVVAGTVQAGGRVLNAYGYNVLGRLTTVTQDGTTKTEYEYDSAGNRKQVDE